jgi:hypothetical protein
LNFEQLLQTYITDYSRISNKKQAFQNILNECSNLKLKKEKLKLGKVTFVFNYHYYGAVVIYEDVEMVYCRQDNTDENERKIEFILQRYS